MTQRTIEIATALVNVNHRITIPVTLQLRPSKGSTNLNILKAHTNIFSPTKLIDLTLKLITFQNKQLTPQTNSYPSRSNTHQDSKIFTKIQKIHVFTYLTKSKAPFLLVKSNTATDNNYQISLIH